MNHAPRSSCTHGSANSETGRDMASSTMFLSTAAFVNSQLVNNPSRDWRPRKQITRCHTPVPGISATCTGPRERVERSCSVQRVCHSNELN